MITLKILPFCLLLLAVASQGNFSFNSTDFLLNGKPFRIMSGELHFARIPHEYWSHRLKMAKAMGLNTIAAYVFWNFHQSEEDGPIDFESPSHDFGRFLDLAQEEGLYVLLRAGPYVCAEWDFGGLPSWLLKHEDLKPRSYNQKYLSYVEKYFKRLAEIIVPRQIDRSAKGNIIMVQLENEFGSFGNDPQYIIALQKLWLELGITVPFYSADGGSYDMLSHGHVPGAALGLDPGNSQSAYDAAKSVDPNVVSFSSETYPGWLTHWGEGWATVSTDSISQQLEWILSNGHSFNLYMLHGGTNWGFWAGANDGGQGYQPHITSYDYDAPVTENGNVTEKYLALKKIIEKYSKDNLTPIPDPIPTFYIPPIHLEPVSDVWQVAQNWFNSEYPKTFESISQFSGFMIYKTTLDSSSGELSIPGLKDYALVFADDKLVGVLDRTHAIFTLNVKNCSKLEILVEAMGRINFGRNVKDLKGIVGNVTLNGEVVKNWEMAGIPLTDLGAIRNTRNGDSFTKQGIFYQGNFYLNQTKADTFIDVSQNWVKGVIFVNGKNLGRYWNIGPQFRLFCPGTFLKEGFNEIIILELQTVEPKGLFVTGEEALKKTN